MTVTMSASAPALARDPRPKFKMRLADPAVMLAYVSVIFALLLVFFPVSFPQMVVRNWQNSHITPAMILLSVSLNLGLYLRGARLRSGKPSIFASACLGGVPVFVVVGLSFLLQTTIAHTLSGYTPNAAVRVNEEILAHTYFGLIAAIFSPFLVIRFAQQFSKRNP